MKLNGNDRNIYFLLRVHVFFFLYRLILQGLVRPLIVDTLMLVIEYIVHPITSGVVTPLWLVVHTILEQVTNTAMVLVRPSVALLRAIRLVEVNSNSQKDQIESV